MLKRHTKRAILGLLFIGVALTLVIVVSQHYFAGRALAIRLEEERGEFVPAKPLLLTVERQTRSRSRAFAVRLEPFLRAGVAAETSARVQEVFVETGDSVAAGDLLVQLDPTVTELNLSSVEAGLQAAEAQLEEIRRLAAEAERLAESQSVPQTRREAAQAQVKVQEASTRQLQAELHKQEELLQRHQIRAPFAGHVNERLVDEGDSVTPNQPVITLVKLDTLRARVYVSDVEVNSFTQGQEVKLRLDAFPEEPLTAQISMVAQSADPVSNLFLVETRIANPDTALPGGTRGRIVAVVERFTDTLFIPASAVRFDGGRVLAEVWQEEKAQTRELRVGPAIDGDYPVFAGLDEGEVVIVR